MTVVTQKKPVTYIVLLFILFAVQPAVYAQDWVQFADETSTWFPAALRDDPEEKDIAIGDIDRNGHLDIIAVRKEPFSDPGGRSNLLLLNNGSQFTDNTSLIPGFAEATDDRDAVLVDVNNDGWLDIVTVTTFDEMPRVYINQRESSGTWQGFSLLPGAIPTFTPGPKFCAVSVGDIDGVNGPDLYFVDYANDLEDRLLYNRGDGTFDDVTDTALTAAMADSSFGTDTHMVDVNNDGFIDIVKNNGLGGGTSVIYNNGDGTFRQQAIYDRNSYMIEPADFNGDGRVDFYIVDDNADHFLLNRGVGTDGLATFEEFDITDSPATLGWGGNVKVADVNNDNAPDVIIADVDTDEASCQHNHLVLLKGERDGADYRLSDPFVGGTRDWLPTGVFDIEFADFDSDSCLDLLIGQCTTETDVVTEGGAALPGLNTDGWKVFMQRIPDFSVRIEEPRTRHILPTTGTQALLVRVSVLPTTVIAEPSDFIIRIGGQPATILNSARVGRELWFSVSPASGLDNSVDHALEVSASRCSAEASSNLPGIVAFGDPTLSDTVLVVDLSTSMDDNDKIGAAKNAANLWIDTLTDDDRLGIVWFSGRGADGFGIADETFNIARVGALSTIDGSSKSNREHAIDAVNNMTTIGNTPIGEGLRRGALELNEFSPADRERALVLLSDGLENVPRWWREGRSTIWPVPPHSPVIGEFGAMAEPAVNRDIAVHTISLGPEADRGLMDEIASHTSGDTIPVELPGVVGGASLDLDFLSDSSVASLVAFSGGDALTTLSLSNRLANVYEHLHNNVSAQQRLWQTVAISPAAAQPELINVQPSIYNNNANVFNAGVQHIQNAPNNPNNPQESIIVPIEPGLSFATLSVNWDAGTVFSIIVEPPAGQNPADVQRSGHATNTVFKIKNPVPGDWRVRITKGEPGRQLLVALSGRSEISSFVSTAADINGSVKPGDRVPIAAVLLDASGNPILNADVVANASSASGAESLPLKDDGLGADTKADDGVYTGQLSNTRMGGGIAVEVLARWLSAGVEQQRILRSSASLAELDSDNDGMSDEDERRHDFLDPNNPDDVLADPDNDGLITWVELEAETLDPNNPDSDNGGANDGAEFCAGTDPGNPEDDDKVTQDTDGDGMPDVWEKMFGFNINDASDAAIDSDRDNLSNLQEYKHCTSPEHRDTDRDGVYDGVEVADGTDPTLPNRDTEDNATGEDCEPCLYNHYGWLVILLVLLILIVIVFIWVQTKKAHH